MSDIEVILAASSLMFTAAGVILAAVTIFIGVLAFIRWKHMKNVAAESAVYRINF
ncbi:hypothetical protein [Curvivirga sp.]|uniref:hypothetical protein n=1 Tax=Curvivirga sp. TaxID=2856848 RepID=UPI003B59A316